MTFYFIDYTIHIGEYGKQGSALVQAYSEAEAVKIALAGECHGEPEYSSNGYACTDSANEFVYEVTGVKIVPEHELKTLDTYVHLSIQCKETNHG